MRVLSSSKYSLALAKTFLPSPYNLGQREALGFQPKEDSMAKYPDVTAGQTEACINRMGGWDNFLRYIGGQGRVVFPLSVDRTFPFNPIMFIGPDWSISTEDKHSLALTEIEPSSIIFKTMLQGGEQTIAGGEKYQRLTVSNYIRLDAKIFQALWENQHFIPKSWKEKVDGGICYIFFDGTVLQGPDGRRYTLCLYWYDHEWNWDYSWLGCDGGDDSPSAVLTS
jgi:hypothetical protein